MNKAVYLVLLLLALLPGCQSYSCLAPGSERVWGNFSYVWEEDFRYHSNDYGDFDIVILYQSEETIGTMDHYRIGQAMEEVIEHYTHFGTYDRSVPLPLTILVADRGLTNDLCHSEGDNIVGCSCAYGDLYPASREYEHQIVVWDGFYVDDFQGPLTIQHELLHILSWLNGDPQTNHTNLELWNGYW